MRRRKREKKRRGRKERGEKGEGGGRKRGGGERGGGEGKKEKGDNLGEELLAICIHILSHMPGVQDGKFCIITDNKGAAGRVDALFKRTALQYEGKRIIIFSTPKLVQVLYNKGILTDRNHLKAILDTGIKGNVVVLGTRIYDLRSKEISLSCEELTDLIMKPNGISITF